MTAKDWLEELRKDFLTGWRSENGQCQIYARTNGSGEPDNHNCNIFDGYFFAFLYLFRILKAEDRDRVEKLINQIRTRDKDNNVVPGLFNRHPRNFLDVKKDDVISHDEYTGIVAMAYVIRRFDIIEEVLDYGYRHGFSYNNHSHPDNSNFVEHIRYTRQGVNIAFYEILAGRIPTAWNTIWFIVSTFLTLLKPKIDTDGKMMAWLKLSLCSERNDIIWFTFWIWKRIMFCIYKDYQWQGNSYGPLETIFRIYFKPDGYPLHGFAKYWDENFK